MKKSNNQTEGMQNKPASAGLVNFVVKTFCSLALVGFMFSYSVAVPPPPPPPLPPPPALVVPPPPPALVIPPPPEPYRKGLRPPPRGKVWVEINGLWSLVIAPPAYGPFIWIDGGWVPDPTPPPPAAEWVPGHWGRHGWVPGHWRAVAPAPYPDLIWAPGYWNGNIWVSGHWSGNHPHNKRWVPGHHGAHGWVPGHWR